MNNRISHAAIALVAALLASTDCRALEGSVTAAGSKAPIAGVFVIVQWKGVIIHPVEQFRYCYHAEIARTDATGRYKIAEFPGLPPFGMAPQGRTITAYSPGLEEEFEDRIVPYGTVPKERTDIVLRPRTRTGSRSYQYQVAMSGPTGAQCDLPAKARRELELAKLAEGRELATTPDELQTIQFMQDRLDKEGGGESDGMAAETVESKASKTRPSDAVAPR